MVILALDCASKTGWACNDYGSRGRIESGTQEFTLRRGASPGMRFLEFRKWLSDLVRDVNPEVIVYEAAHHRGGAATELCVGFTTRVQEIASECGCEYRSIHSATLKKFATGSGRASKEEMIAAAVKLKGEPVIDDNEADALLMLHWALKGFPE